MALTQSPEYRAELAAAIQVSAEAFVAACRAVTDPFKPVEQDGWNMHQIAAHVRDVQAVVYGLRIRRSVEEDNPLLPNFDQEPWMAEHYNPQEPIADILDDFTRDVASLTTLLRGLPDAAWNRPSRHESQGDFIMQTWVERALAHIREHLETIQKA